MVAAGMAESNGSAEPLRVLIADDHPVFRYGIKALLVASLEAEVVGEAATGLESIVYAEQLTGCHFDGHPHAWRSERH